MGRQKEMDSQTVRLSMDNKEDRYYYYHYYSTSPYHFFCFCYLPLSYRIYSTSPSRAVQYHSQQLSHVSRAVTRV
jgi:hypothetical protein